MKIVTKNTAAMLPMELTPIEVTLISAFRGMHPEDQGAMTRTAIACAEDEAKSKTKPVLRVIGGL